MQRYAGLLVRLRLLSLVFSAWARTVAGESFKLVDTRTEIEGEREEKEGGESLHFGHHRRVSSKFVCPMRGSVWYVGFGIILPRNGFMTWSLGPELAHSPPHSIKKGMRKSNKNSDSVVL